MNPIETYEDVCKKETTCIECGGENGEHQMIEILGDGENFEWDVVGEKPCPLVALSEEI